VEGGQEGKRRRCTNRGRDEGRQGGRGEYKRGGKERMVERK
jgi:hypothetical protein